MARANAAFESETEETERDVQYPASRSSYCQMHWGLDEDEPLPSGPLEARLKTTPTPSLALQLALTCPFFFFFFLLCSFGLSSHHSPIKYPILTSHVFLMSLLFPLDVSGLSSPPPSHGFITLNYLNYHGLYRAYLISDSAGLLVTLNMRRLIDLRKHGFLVSADGFNEQLI